MTKIVLLIVVVLVALYLLIGRNIVKVPSATTVKTATPDSVSLQTDYQNPFDKSAQYVNPFDSHNPFDDLK